jgi:hypothetical protein
MKQLREMVVANQNETVRKDNTQAQVYLATIGLMSCVAVLFYSPTTARVSLTHADANTDLNFLAQEHDWVGADSQVFMIKNKGDFYLPVQAMLMALGVSNIAVQASPEGTVVFNHVKASPQFFKMKDFINLSIPGEMPTSDNKLYELKYHPTFSEPNMLLVQKRTYMRQLNGAASLISSHLPLVVHQETGWLSTSYELGPDVISRISNGKIANRAALDSIHYVWPRYQILLSAIQEAQHHEECAAFSQLAQKPK